jgi:Mrp family chromosome partitioning ATPase
MEKLQLALEKARAERSRSAPSREPVPSAETAATETTVDTTWEAIRPVKLDPDTLRRNRVVSYEGGRNSGAFDILRTKTLLQMRKNGWRRIAITSPTAVCGKSTIACNLAVGMSRQNDLRTIAIELDLHRPSMTTILGVRPDRDVTEMIQGTVSFAEQAVKVRDNVALSLARRASSDPTRHLLSQNMEDRLNEIEEAYAPDMMLFDMPPVLVSDDTRAFLSKVDCAMIVARAEKTTVGQIDICEREIAEHTNVLGVVLNQGRFTDSDYGYDYGYSSELRG